MQRILLCLKATHFIPPVVALVLVGAWNASQWRQISSLSADSAELRGEISAAKGSRGVSSDSAELAATRKSSGTTRKPPADWRDLAARMAELERGDVTNVRAAVDFQQRLSEMSREEIIAALDEISGLELSDEERRVLEGLLIDPLIKQDPQYALNRFAHRIESEANGIGWKLSTALRDWAKKDLAGATAWFDQQIGNGTFESKTLDGKSEMRVKFEAALMESLLATDPDAAASRLAALPDDQRREVLEQLPFDELSPDNQKTYAGLVRELIPEDERAGSFAHIAGQLVDASGYAQVSEFLDAVQATPSEREAAAAQAAQSRLESLGMRGVVSRQDVDSLREWLTRQAPEKVDSITGKALAEAAQESGKFQFSHASELVLQYQQSSGSDDVLVAFLQSYAARSNLDEAQHLAEKISDEKRRAQILKQLK
jgi:hypothetical protein